MKPDIKKKITDDNPSKVKELRLENGMLKTVPPELRNFNKVKLLNLFNNRLSELPEFLNNMSQLENLNLSNNHFINFPETTQKFPNLKVLILRSNLLNNLIGLEGISNTIEKIDLSGNKLDILRINLEPFDKLRSLDLSNNRIEKFPKSLNTKELKTLKLSGNQIKIIPANIKELKGLRELDLSFNKITELPDEICELTGLQTLNLSGNKILRLPKNFDKLINLRNLNLNGNSLGDVPVEIAAQGVKGVLNYYLHLGISVELNEAKLLIVGHGAVGKTHLMKKMIDNSIPEPRTTEGIDIVKWNMLDEKENREIRLNTWDFGGQEIYHSTHQFFLTKRSIYLFVWEARKDEAMINFDYWLNIVQMLSNSSPIIVVLNKIDERVKTIDHKSLTEKFTNIMGFASVSAKTGENLQTLINDIKKQLFQLPHLKDKLPKVWHQIREQLEQIKDNHISYDQYLTICNENGLNKEQAKHLSKYFHDLGVFLHFENNNLLKTVVFLKPEWATNSVYKILDTKEVIDNGGVFNSDLLERQLPTYQTSQVSYVIELMKMFELCFELRSDHFIVPELLNPSAPDENFDNTGGISMLYKYDFMPAGIAPRLIIKLKNHLTNDLYWKNGVFLEWNETKARVISNQYTRTIKIEVVGDDKGTILEIIRIELDNIHKSLNNPSFESKIMCCCSECSKNDVESYMFDYEFLLKAKRKELKTVQCQESLTMVNLIELIGPYERKLITQETLFRYNYDDLIVDLVEISSRILERKMIYKNENEINDKFTDFLRTKGYIATDQTRSGKSKKEPGELDIMIRTPSGLPISIIEALKIQSCGLGNNEIIDHLNKLLLDYDTNGLDKNFILVYSYAENFGQLWQNYVRYISELSNHSHYRKDCELAAFVENNDYTSNSNIKILYTQHLRNGVLCEVYHFILNLKS